MEDLIIDYVGVLLGATLDNFPVASGFISFTAEYNPTDEFMEYYDDTIHPNMIFTSVNDYSGWKYMLNFKLSGFRNVGVELPAFMNYMQLNVGYFSYGYSEYDYFEKSNSRNLFFGMSLNSMEVVNDIARDRDSNYYKASQTILSIYHPPLGYKYIIRDKRKRSDSETLYDVGLINGEGNDK